MAQEHDAESFIDYTRHRQEWKEQRVRPQQQGKPARFTVRAVVEVLHDYLKEARVRGHHFRSDEAGPGGNAETSRSLFSRVVRLS